LKGSVPERASRIDIPMTTRSHSRLSDVRLATALLFGAASLLLLPAIASAHLGHVVQRAERYLKVDLQPRELRLVVSLTLGPSEMARVLDAADTDHDRDVSRAEADAYLDQWGRGLADELPVQVDGQRVSLSYRDAYFDPIGPVRAQAGTVEMVGHVELSGGEHSLELRDGMRVATFDRTDVTFQARDGVELLASGLQGATSVERRLSYGRDGPNRRLSVRARFPAEPLAWQGPAAAAAALAVLVLAGGAWLSRRRRKPAHSKP